MVTEIQPFESPDITVLYFGSWGSNWIGAYFESSTTILLIIGGNDVLHYIHLKSNYMFRLST